MSATQNELDWSWLASVDVVNANGIRIGSALDHAISRHVTRDGIQYAIVPTSTFRNGHSNWHGVKHGHAYVAWDGRRFHYRTSKYAALAAARPTPTSASGDRT